MFHQTNKLKRKIQHRQKIRDYVSEVRERKRQQRQSQLKELTEKDEQLKLQSKETNDLILQTADKMVSEHRCTAALKESVQSTYEYLLQLHETKKEEVKLLQAELDRTKSVEDQQSQIQKIQASDESGDEDLSEMQVSLKNQESLENMESELQRLQKMYQDMEEQADREFDAWKEEERTRVREIARLVRQKREPTPKHKKHCDLLTMLTAKAAEIEEECQQERLQVKLIENKCAELRSLYSADVKKEAELKKLQDAQERQAESIILGGLQIKHLPNESQEESSPDASESGDEGPSEKQVSLKKTEKLKNRNTKNIEEKQSEIQKIQDPDDSGDEGPSEKQVSLKKKKTVWKKIKHFFSAQKTTSSI